MSLPDLSTKSPVLRWLLLAGMTLTLAVVSDRFHIPASLFLSAMASGIILALSGGLVKVPRPLFKFCQSVVGCMIARSISLDTLHDISRSWHLFLLMVLSVTLVATAHGWFLARSGALPGTTAIWGTSPGGALVMTLMSEGYGADSRLVAFMQYTRVMLVSITAAGVSAIWGEPLAGKAAMAAARAAEINPLEFAKTLALIGFTTVASRFIKMPSAPILLPLILGPLLNLTGVVHITLPWWLLWGSYFVVGWSIGLRFTREIVRHAFRALPRIIATLISMIAFCGVLGYFFSGPMDIDLLTAYLSASPGGMDSIAIIASTTGGNMSFVMAVQTTRFIVVTLFGPALTTYVVTYAGLTKCDKN